MEKFTHEEFLEKLPKDRDYEVIGKYANSNTRILIKNRYGLYFMFPISLLKGCKPNALSALDKNLYFTNRAKEVHKDFYNYRKIDYKGVKNSKVIITCLIHGDFSQDPKCHLQGQGCPKCGKIKAAQSCIKNECDIVEKFKKIHGIKYDYSKIEYNGLQKEVIINCKIHGDFKQTISNHLQGAGCKKCGIGERIKICTHKASIKFIPKASILHNNKYDYSKTTYINKYTNITIICPIHGDFSQTPGSHLQGSGCPKCGRENLGFNRSKFTKRAEGKLVIFYTLKCWKEEESFYKIGITSTSTEKRYDDKIKMPYSYKIIQEIKSFDAEYIWDLELETKRKLKDSHYTPQIPFKGSVTECFLDVKLLLSTYE